MVPKKGLEPPHPCGYMDLNHARLPIPPLRQVISQRCGRAALKEDTATSILTRHGLSVKLGVAARALTAHLAKIKFEHKRQ
jgi:hypothetical protein